MTIKIPRSAVNIHSFYSDMDQRTDEGFSGIKEQLRTARDKFAPGILEALPENRAAAAISFAASGGDALFIGMLLATEDWPAVVHLMLDQEGPVARRRVDEAHLFAQGCDVSLAAIISIRGGNAPPPPVNLDTPIR